MQKNNKLKKRDEYDYDGDTLQKIIEKYLMRSILEEDILKFLRQQQNIPSESIASLLAENAGKAQNTIYKNINEYTNYSGSSLLRYWSSMVHICTEYAIPTKDIPSLDSLLEKYQYLLDFIIQISIESKLAILIDSHEETTWEIYNVFKNRFKNTARSVDKKENALIEQLATYPAIQRKIKEKETTNLERLRRK